MAQQTVLEASSTGRAWWLSLRALLRRSTARSRRDVLFVALASAVCAAVYAVLGLVRLRTFEASSFDLVIFDQAVRGYAELRAPTIPVRGVMLGEGPDFLQLADHFSPILAVLAPLYWIYDGPATLIIAQAVLLASAIVPIWLFARRKLGTKASYLVAVAYATSAPVAYAVAFDFHEVAFVPLLTAVMIERFDAGKHVHGVLAAAGLLLVKEDMGLLVAGFGCYLLVTRRRWIGAGFVVGGLAAIAIIRGVLIPAVGGDPKTFWAYDHLGSSVMGVLHTAVTDPGLVLSTLVTPNLKLFTVLALLWPLAFVCLCSPLILPAIPLVLERMLADSSLWWTGNRHYNTFLIAILICSAVDGAARIQRVLVRWRGSNRPSAGESRARWIGLGWAAFACAATLALIPLQPLGKLLQPSFYRGGPEVTAAAQAAATVPSDVTVEAVDHIGPALTHRTTVLLWSSQPHGSPWVIADVERRVFPFGSKEGLDLQDQRRQVTELVGAGYRIIFQRDGYIVLHNPAAD